MTKRRSDLSAQSIQRTSHAVNAISYEPTKSGVNIHMSSETTPFLGLRLLQNASRCLSPPAVRLFACLEALGCV
jgi:hypothetical protein